MDEIDTAAVRQFVANGDAFLPDGPKTAILPAIVLEAIADEIDALRARLDAVEAERDEAIAGRKLDLQGAASYFELHQDIWRKGADNLRARLAEVEAERDLRTWERDQAVQRIAEHDDLRARLAEVESERDHYKTVAYLEHGKRQEVIARLAEVEALDPDDLGHGLFCASHYESRPCDCWAIVVRAAARGEGDRG